MTSSPEPLLPDSASYDYDVFISYSTQNKVWVRGELLTRLKSVGLKCCIDYRDFRLGAPAIAELKRAATTSRKTLLVLTPDYLQSKWTEFERYLLQTHDPLNKELRLIPLLKELCDLPEDIAYLTYLNFAEADDEGFAWMQLLTALGKPPDATPPLEEIPQNWLLAHPYGMPPHFTGRVAERQMLSRWLMQLQHPLLVLRALGGFGKSALTWQWLLQDVEPRQWRQVVWWSFYEEQAGFDNFLRKTWAYLMGREPGEIPLRQQLEQLLEVLKRQPVLLVLDGFERELRAYSSLGAAYQGDGDAPIGHQNDRAGRQNDRDCVNPYAERFLRNLCSLPQMRGKVLMTARLRPSAVEVRGGTLLQGCEEEELTQMQPDDAIVFFRVQGVRGNRAEIAQACEAYGYHPLSLRLLAGLVVNDWVSPGDIRVAQGLDVSGDLVQRQHHVLEQSYQSLAEGQRQLLSRIACFRSPVVFGVIEATAIGAAAAIRQLQADLRDLMNRGLLQHDRSTQRFDLHPIVRRYAYDRMGNPERTSTHEQLRDYFAAVPAPNQVKTIADLAPVIELYHHMVRSGQYDEARQLFYDRLRKPLYYQLGAYLLQIELLRALFSQGEDHPPQLQDKRNQAWTLNELAKSYSLNGQPAQAVPLFEQAAAMAEKQEDKGNLAIGLGNLAYQQLSIGSLQAAETNLRRQIALCQETENEFVEAVGYAELGRLLVFRGLWADAETEFTEALRLFERTHVVQYSGVAWAYRALSALLQVRAGEEQAVAALVAAGRSLELADETAHTQYPYARDYVRSHWLLGAAHRVNHHLDESDHHLNEALTRCRAINSVEPEADILLDLARLRLDQNQPEEALRLATEAQEIAQRSGYVLQEADVQLFFAERALEQGNVPEALSHARESRRLATCDGREFVYKVTYDAAGELLRRITGQ